MSRDMRGITPDRIKTCRETASNAIVCPLGYRVSAVTNKLNCQDADVTWWGTPHTRTDATNWSTTSRCDQVHIPTAQIGYKQA